MLKNLVPSNKPRVVDPSRVTDLRSLPSLSLTKSGSKCYKNGTFSPHHDIFNSVKTSIDSYRQEQLLDQLEVGSA